MSTQLELQAHEARTLLADLLSIGIGDLDEEEIATVIEGETDLVSAVSAAIVEVGAAEAAAGATAALLIKLAARRERKLAYAERIRARIAQALSSLGLRRLTTAAGTVSVVAAPARVIVTDEAAVPSWYWREKVVRTIDKQSIRDSLKTGQPVPGAELSNRYDTIRVRT